MNINTAIYILTAISALSAFSVAILQSKKQENDSIDNLKQQEKITELQGKLLNKSETLINGQNTVISLQKEVDEKNNKIRELQNETINNITGGNQVPNIWFSVSRDGIMGFASNIGKYPISNVSANLTEVIEDFDTTVDGKTFHPIERSKFTPIIIGDIMKMNQKPFFERQYDQVYKKIRFVYQIMWRNGGFSGTFVVNNNGASIPEISDAKITMYTKGFNFKGSMKINDVISQVMPIIDRHHNLYDSPQ